MRRIAAAVLLALAAALPAAAASPAAEAAPRPSYGPEEPAAPTPLEARALAAVRARLSPPPQPSGRLSHAARELAALAAEGAPRPAGRGALRGALARALAWDPSPAVVLVSAGPQEAAEAATRALPAGGATHVGVGAAERDGRAFVVLLLSRRRARLDPFPRDVAPGEATVISGAVGDPLRAPRVFVTRPGGGAVEVGGGPGRGFKVPIAFPEPGRHVVEVVGEGPSGPEVAAILAVAAGGAPLDPPARPPSPPEPPDRASAERGVLEALNATRRARGLAPVAADPALGAVARRHSEAMAEAGQVGHVVPGSGEAGERLRRAGVPYRRAYENVARAATSLDAHAGVEESPAHLANVLRPAATRAGVGVARGRLPNGDPLLYLTEVLVEPPDDGADSRLTPDARVREALWRERARTGAPPLTADPALDALAREAASGLRDRDDTDPEGVGDRALALRRTVAAVDVFVASAPDEASRSANLRDGRFARAGVGIVAGDSPRFGKGRLWIVVIYSD